MPAISFKQNFLAPTGFRFVIQRLPHVQFFVQTANIPGVSTGYTETATPFKPLYRHGDRLQYDEFTLSIRVDQEMKSYLEIFNWLEGLTSPENFETYANLLAGDGAYSDATLTILNNKQNPAIIIKFKDIFPIALGGINMNTTEIDIDYVTVDITFKTGGWTIEPVQRRTAIPITYQEDEDVSLEDQLAGETDIDRSLYDSNINS